MLGIIRPLGPNTFTIDLDKILQLMQLMKTEGIDNQDIRKVEQMTKEAMVKGEANVE